jgi:hypothetical protein
MHSDSALVLAGNLKEEEEGSHQGEGWGEED